MINWLLNKPAQASTSQHKPMPKYKRIVISDAILESAKERLAAGVDADTLDVALALAPGTIASWIERGKQYASKKPRCETDTRCRALWQARAKAIADRAVGVLDNLEAIAKGEIADAPVSAQVSAAKFLLERELSDKYAQDYALIDGLEVYKAKVTELSADLGVARARITELEAQLEAAQVDTDDGV